ncbi:MAG TPA: hypothetical protein VIG32_06660 [Candidatus Baltobacteraceae bacterium]
MRMRRLRDAEQVVRHTHPRADRLDDLAHCYMLLGTILERKNDRDGADEARLDARAYAFSIPSVALHSELRYYEAHAAVLRRDLPTAQKIAQEALSEVPGSHDEPHSRPLGVARAYLFELLGFIEGHHGRFHDQIACLSSALYELDTLDRRDVWAEASLLNNLASVVGELYVPHIETTMRSRAESLPWSTETHGWAYNVHRALGWHSALAGDVSNCMRDLREADVFATSNAWRIDALLDRAYLFHELGEANAARDRLDEAHRLSQTVDWASTDGEERLALLWLAENMASHNMAHAAFVVNQYKAIRKPLDPRFAYSNDRRFRGHELDALGAVAALTGQTMRGLTMLNEARDLWQTLGFAWRAAKTARTIARITHSESDLAEARHRAAPWPNSWLANAA